MSNTVNARLVEIFERNIAAPNDPFYAKITDGTDTVDIIPVDGYKGLVAVAPGHVSTDNSTTDLLLAGATFTGVWENITNFGVIVITLKASHVSAADGLMVEFSNDGTNVISDDVFTVPANIGKTYSFQAAAQYFRVKYTNSGTDQTSFALQIVLKPYYVKPSSHRIQDNIIDDDDGELTLSVLKLRTAADTYVSGAATNNGNFKVSLEELESGVSTNSNSQLNTSPYMVDEFGIYAHQLADNIFRGANIAISPEHHEIHCGDSYEATDNVTLGNGATRDYLIIVPNEGTISGTNPGADQSIKIYHMLELIEAESEIEVTLYEGADRVAGTAITSFNRNRNSTYTDTLDISYGPTGGTTDGTIIWGPWRVGSGRADAGTRDRNSEFVLKDNTKYILKIVNQTTSNNNVNVEFDYYVHPGV
jgi:hypothetical protein